jgi:hypothetical protein
MTSHVYCGAAVHGGGSDSSASSARQAKPSIQQDARVYLRLATTHRAPLVHLTRLLLLLHRLWYRYRRYEPGVQTSMRYLMNSGQPIAAPPILLPEAS